MPSSVQLIREMMPLVCGHCQKIARLPQAVTVGMLPLTLTCPYCSEASVWEDELPRLPKVDPNQHSAYWMLGSVEHVENLEAYLREEEKKKPATPGPSFTRNAEAITKQLHSLLCLTKEMAIDIAEFESKMIDFFSEEHRLGKVFKDSWDPDHLRDFVINPYVSIPLECGTDISSSYSRLILAPKFYDANFGVRLTSKGGYRVELINQYTRIGKPLTDMLCGYLDVPGNLDITVVGRKLVGSDVGELYKQIPGVVEDDDHTEDNPSVIIHDSLKARMWLANHGVHPWTEREISEDDLFITPGVKEIIAESVNYTDVYNAFMDTSRIGLFWNDTMRAREISTVLCSAVAGFKLIFVGEESDKDKWNSVYRKQMFTHSRRGELVYHVNSEPLNLAMLNGINTIVVDADSGVSVERVAELYNYLGRAIVIGHNPLMDCLHENDVAMMMYGLAGASNWQYDVSVEEWQLGKVFPTHSIMSSLYKLRK